MGLVTDGKKRSPALSELIVATADAGSTPTPLSPAGPIGGTREKAAQQGK